MKVVLTCILFFFSSRRRHTRFSRDWSSDVCSSDLAGVDRHRRAHARAEGRARVGVDGNPHRNTLDDLDPVAGGVVRRKEDRKSVEEGKRMEEGTGSCRNYKVSEDQRVRKDGIEMAG